MSAAWTTETVRALAPDGRSARAGQALAAAPRWTALGSAAGETTPRLLWGQCQGSAKTPYQVCVDSAGPAFKCTCPSRKTPCKHTLGLLFHFVNQPTAFVNGAPPPFVIDWQEKRARPPAPAAPPDETARQKRQQQRLARVQLGLREFDRWLADLVAAGLAAAPALPAAFWDEAAARLVDAQAGALAPLVRRLGLLPREGGDWPGAMLAEIGRLHLLCRAFQQYERLTAPQQADLRAAIGWAANHDDIRREPGSDDDWIVLGRRVLQVERLHEQRTWLWGRRSHRPALILDYAHGRDPLDSSLLPGTVAPAELAFFPSAAPLRALVKKRTGPTSPVDQFPGHKQLKAALDQAAAAWTANPWLTHYPLPLTDVVPHQAGRRWWLRDGTGRQLPLSDAFNEGWSLLALSGGRPLALLAEWDGAALLPLTVFNDGHFTALRSQYP